MKDRRDTVTDLAIYRAACLRDKREAAWRKIDEELEAHCHRRAWPRSNLGDGNGRAYSPTLDELDGGWGRR